jgi:hypothetical protein
VTTEDMRRRQGSRSAVRAMLHAVAAVQRHPDAAPLHDRARRECATAVAAVTSHDNLVLTLRAQAIGVDDDLVPTGGGDGPFAALRGAGIGELVLRRGIAPATVDALVHRLAALRGDADPEVTIAGLVGPAGLPHVQLRALPSPDHEPQPLHEPWPLPPPGLAALALRALVEREAASNLPALAARQLLEELETAPLASTDLLEGLFARLLGSGDLAAATWLLDAVAHHPGVPAGSRDRLLAQAVALADDTWLAHQLDRGAGNERLDLAAFVMQLGEPTTQRFCRLADAAGQPWSRWLGDLLGNRPNPN